MNSYPSVPGWWRSLTQTEQEAIARQFWEVGRLTLEWWLTPRLAGDRFHRWPGTHVVEEEPAKTGGFVVELARSGQEFVIPEGKSILQVLLDAGGDVDYSCELGICGACEQRVISGTPEHRDAILTEEEQRPTRR